MNIGARIASERKALGYSQAAFAEQVSVSLSSQKRYEKDERAPDTAYLTAISKVGVDIGFVLTGERQPDLQPELDGASHVIDLIMGFLGFGKGPLNREFENAVQLAAKSPALWRKDPDKNLADADRLDQPLHDILRKSPVLLDKFQLGDVIERIMFVSDAKNLALSPREAAEAILTVYSEERETGKQLSFSRLMEITKRG
jgi:transcriptional regulator with XRE-family HTH domain